MKRTHVVDSYEVEGYLLECRVAPEVWACVPPGDRRTIAQNLWEIAEFMTQAQADYFRIESNLDEVQASEAEAQTQIEQAIEQTETEAKPKTTRRKSKSTDSSPSN